jgi:hypothetical protein
LLAAGWFLTDNEGTEALATPNRLDIAKLNEVMPIFIHFIKCVA